MLITEHLKEGGCYEAGFDDIYGIDIVKCILKTD